MSLHRYPGAALTADYLRGGGGLLLTAGPLLALPLHWIMAVLFGSCALLFAAFMLRTALRQFTVIEATDQGIASRGPLSGRAIRWDELARLRLTYYSTRRDRERGWMQLTLKGRGRALAMDSALDGFDAVADRAAHAAQVRGVEITDATRDNLAALGILAPSGGSLAERWGLTGDRAPVEEASPARSPQRGATP